MDEFKTANNANVESLILFLENEDPLKHRFAPLQKFFNGQVKEYQVQPYLNKTIVSNSFEAIYLDTRKILQVAGSKRLFLMWQFGDKNEVNTIDVAVTASLKDFKISDFIPPRFAATKVAVVAVADDTVNIKLIYLLTGTVSATDPIHEIIANKRK